MTNKGGPALVIGASGFLGGHVVRALAARGREVRILARPSSDLSGLDGLAYDKRIGDLADKKTLLDAMKGCGTIFHGAVDTRAWLSDPAPLYRTNVDGLVNSMEAALETGVERFVHTGTIGTIGVHAGRPVTEDDAFNWYDRAPQYLRSRADGEKKFFEYCRERGLPGISLCVANTYGPHDRQPTPHGELLWQAAKGTMPFVLNAGVPWVDVRDAAEALLLAEDKGRTGTRYIVSAGHVTQTELHALAAAVLGKRPPRTMPVRLALAAARASHLVSRIRGLHDQRLCPDSIVLATAFGPLDSARTREDLGWTPRPLEESVQDAVRWFSEHHLSTSRDAEPSPDAPR
ncbi:NAD-dependent epimerase/dehydratase family protein [Actinocorallia populi]|uniref:NAD-dependent epimerase/dehydratase family protein n=1 Tax=Actinocorallia populi TaxID=2079200 RepID=UPI0013005F0F|nr:NAD-dependent epimerase/dehydratase family protein [Actinocorallia populi]